MFAIDDSYRLVERLGSGGMGSVWLARHAGYDRDVAIKVLSPSMASQPAAVDKFRREIRSHAGLNHPNIVRLFDAGTVAGDAEFDSHGELVGGTPFYAMEYAPEGTLWGEPVIDCWATAESILRQLLRALAYAHARSVVHRDLKPSNVLRFSPDEPAVKIADFGLAFSGGPGAEISLAEGGEPVGTADYMAPEQIRGEWRRYGPWTDLYAVGCMAFEFVTGRRPYPERTEEEIARAHLESPVPTVDPLFAIPDGFDDWLEVMMSKEPTGRYWRAADAEWALETIARGFEPSTEDERGGGGGATDTPTTLEGPTEVDFARAPTARAEPLESSAPPTPVAQTRPEGQEFEAPVGDSESQPLQTPGERPPLPETWRDPVSESLVDLIDRAPAPLGLFGVREVPFVDRNSERDLLWQMLGSMLEHEHTRVALVTGEQGVGKSRLVEWMAYRAAEVGACIDVQVGHGRRGGLDGIAGMLEGIFSTRGMTRSEVERQVQRVLGAWCGDRLDEEAIALDARALTTLLRPMEPEGRGSSYRFAQICEQFAVVERVLFHLARRRPLFVRFDDAHRSPTTLAFVEFLLESSRRIPMLMALTLLPPAALPEGRRGQFDRLTGFRRVRRLGLSPLDRDHHRELVDRLLALEGSLAERVVERTAGMPLFAVELVRQWVDRQVLEPADGGYRLVDGAGHRLPDDLHDIWEHRLEHLLAGPTGLSEPEGRIALELAALLGERVGSKEWQAACRLEGIGGAEGLRERLIEQGLVFPQPGGWRFAHGMFVESLIRGARDAGRHGRLARRCAEAIAECYPANRRETAERRAGFLEQADRPETAIDALESAVEYALDIGDLPRATEVLDRREELFERRGIDTGDRRRQEDRLRRGRLDLNAGRHERAARHLETVVEQAEREGWRALEGRALVVWSLLHRRGGRQEEAVAVLERAHELLEAEGDRDGLAGCLRKKGMVYGWNSQMEKARRALEDSRAMYAELDEPHEAIQSASLKIYPMIYSGQRAEAERLAEEIIERARRLGNRWAERESVNQLGEIARYDGRYEAAREHYEEYRRLNETMGMYDEQIARLNLALVDLADGENRRAVERFEGLGRETIGEGVRQLLPTIYLGMIAAFAALEQWGRWSVAVEQARESLADIGSREFDQIWLIEMALERTRRSDDPGRVQRVELVADILREDLPIEGGPCR